MLDPDTRLQMDVPHGERKGGNASWKVVRLI